MQGSYSKISFVLEVLRAGVLRLPRMDNHSKEFLIKLTISALRSIDGGKCFNSSSRDKFALRFSSARRELLSSISCLSCEIARSSSRFRLSLVQKPAPFAVSTNLL